MSNINLTIFTPTYNRAYILPKLKGSLCHQDRFDFEWLVIDDGSTDNTEDLFNQWKRETLPFQIRYVKVQNGGKPRAINKACELAQADWMFIIDSDDTLVPNFIDFIMNAITEVQEDEAFVGIGVLRGHDSKTPLGKIKFKDYIDATNLERPKFGLNFDCNEAYRVSILKRFPFQVWPGENFVPEETVLNELSIQGYKLRWYDKVGVLSEYLDDGLTKGAWNLIKKNPMGYAMLYNHKLKYTKEWKLQINYVCQFIALCLMGHNFCYIKNCNKNFLSIAMLPLGYILFLRRKRQFSKD